MTKEDTQGRPSPSPVRLGLSSVVSRNLLEGSSHELLQGNGLIDVIAIIDAALEVVDIDHQARCEQEGPAPAIGFEDQGAGDGQFMRAE